MDNCANEHPGPADIARVEQPVTHQNASDGLDQMMFIKVIAMLLANQDPNGTRELDLHRQMDLGQLIFFLSEHPSEVLTELKSELEVKLPDVVSALPLAD